MRKETDSLPEARSRRGFLAASSVSLLAASGCASTTPPAATRFSVEVLNDPKFNVEAMARLTSTMTLGETGRTYYSGKAFGVFADGRTIPFYGIDGLGSLRALPQPGGAIRFLFSEFAVYTDIVTGEPLKTWKNPVTNETVEVWHQRNGPVNYELDPAKPSFGAFTRTAASKPGFLLPWRVSGDTATFVIDTVSERKNPMDPAVWKRESSGATMHISEHGQYAIALDDLLNPEWKSLQLTASLQSIKPWHPWMMMGQLPGKVFTVMTARRVRGLDELPAAVAAVAREQLAGYLEPPPDWTGAYITANTIYMRSHQPSVKTTGTT